MILNTHPENRKEMVRAISELTGTDAVYMFTPTYAFTIGSITVNRDGTIDCEDETMIETIKPMLTERGWLEPEHESESEAEPEHETESEPEVELEHEAEPEHEAPADLEEIPEADEGLTVARMDITMPVEGWTVSKLTNLLRLLYAKQDLINRMLDYNLLYIEESFVTAISEHPPETVPDFEARVQKAIEGECIHGLNIADEKVTISTPFVADEPARQTAYSKLLRGILKAAEAASRVSIKRQDDSENEKYHANSWLMRMGFGGADFKDTRRILMKHLNGFAAFKSKADMELHKARQAQRRQESRGEQE